MSEHNNSGRSNKISAREFMSRYRVPATTSRADALERARAELTERYLLSRRTREGKGDVPGDVVGVGIGRKLIDGEDTRVPAVVVLVRRKVPRSRLSSNDVIRRELHGVPIDVRESTPDDVRTCVGSNWLNLVGHHRRPSFPVVAGTQIGLFGSRRIGTCGAIVKKDGRLFGLTCRHVLLGADDPPKSPVRILQPGNGLTRARDIGVLSAGGVAPMNLFNVQDEPVNELDAAIFEFHAGLRPSPDIMRLCTPVPKAYAPMPNRSVKKAGAGSAVRYGTIDLENLTRYIRVNGGTHYPLVAGLFTIRPSGAKFASDGDSGALVLDASSNGPLGMIIAAGEKTSKNKDGSRAQNEGEGVAIPLGKILNHFGATLA